MKHSELLRKIQETREAIIQYKIEGLDRDTSQEGLLKLKKIREESALLITEAKFIGASGQICPLCGGKGRI